MDNPVLVEVTRGAEVESRHRGAVSVVDAEGTAVLAVGDVECRVFPRSAVKALQALPLVEGGFADQYGLTDAEIALACASHAGEPEHVAAAAAMLKKAGQPPGCLECGTHWPLGEDAARTLAAAGGHPTALHNNCSGKHAGFVCLACGLGADPKGYVRPEHPVQRAVGAALEDLTGASHAAETRGIDGCSIPTYAVPLPRARLRLCEVRRRRRPVEGLRAGSRADPRRRRRTPVHGLGHRPLRHAGHGAPRRAGLRQDRRRGRLLRGTAGARLRRRREMRRRRQARRRGRHGERDRCASSGSTTRSARSCRGLPGDGSTTGTASRPARSARPKR